MSYACLVIGSSVHAGGGMSSGNQGQPSSSPWSAQQNWPGQNTQNQTMPVWPQQGGWPPMSPWGMPPSNSAVMPDVSPKEQDAYSQNLNQPGAMPWGAGFPPSGPMPFFGGPWGAQGQQTQPAQPQSDQQNANPWIQQQPYKQAPSSNTQPRQRSGGGMGSGNRSNNPQNRQYGYSRNYSYQSSRQWQSQPPANYNSAPNYGGNQQSNQASNSQAPGTWNNNKQDGPGYPPPGMGYPDWYPQDRLNPTEQNSGFNGMPSWPDNPGMGGFGGMPPGGALNMPTDPNNAQPAWTGDFSSPVPWPSAGTGPAYFDHSKDYADDKQKEKE